MARIEIPDTHHRGILLPGGWTTETPEITIDSSSLRVRDIVSVLAHRGAPRAKAEEYAPRSVEAFFEKAWRARVMKLVGRWARIYANQNFGSLDGFDPEVVARTWIPGGVGGQIGRAEDVRALFVEMRRSLEGG